MAYKSLTLYTVCYAQFFAVNKSSLEFYFFSYFFFLAAFKAILYITLFIWRFSTIKRRQYVWEVWKFLAIGMPFHLNQSELELLRTDEFSVWNIWIV